eukprot:c12168_g1_i3.p1 GENE.c12168_g1_i3~~c12168_g1_i3.p1  ORF type:complete len:301 (+),score=96.90 c12168_g1_i3:651-1553(+)
MQADQNQTFSPKCEECGGIDFVDDATRGDTICTECGVVLRDPFISYDQEWRTFANDDGGDNKARAVSTDPLLESQSTFLQLPASNTGSSMGTLRQKSYRSQQDKNMVELIHGIDRVCEGGSVLEALRDRAKEVAKKMLDMKIRGHSNDVMVATALFIACRTEDASRSMKEICEMANVQMNEFTRCFKVARKGFEGSIGTVNPIQLIPRIANDIKQDNVKFRNACIKVVELLNNEQQGKAPTTIAAASVYLVTSRLGLKNITLGTICGSAKVAEATVQNALRNTTVDITAIIEELKNSKSS